LASVRGAADQAILITSASSLRSTTTAGLISCRWASSVKLRYLVESRLGPAALDALLADLEEGALHLDYGEQDLARVRELISR
jgi:hypothetical protein